MTLKVITNILSRQKSYKSKNKFTCILAGLKSKCCIKAIIPILWLIIQLCTGKYLYPATPPGTIISNTVKVSFTRESNSTLTNSFITKDTNIRKVIDYPAFISPTNSKTVQLGTTVTFSHIVSNSANITNVLQLTASNLSTHPLALYLDINTNGILDAGEPLITSITLGPKEKASIIVTETVPPSIQHTIFTDKITITATYILPNFRTNYLVTSTIDYSVIMPSKNQVIYVFATDGIHKAKKLDGSENLGDLNVTVYVKLLFTPVSGIVDMYYDVGQIPDGSTNLNNNDRKVRMSRENDQWIGIIPSDDPEIVDKAKVQIVFEADDTVFYRMTTPSTQAYSYVVRTYQYKEKGNLLNSILYAEDDSKPKPTIIYDLDKPAHVKIIVYDLRGDKVRTLVDEQRGPGVHEPVIWDGKNDSGKIIGVGLYFITLQYEDVKEVFKVVVIK